MKWILLSNLLVFVGLSLADTSSGIEENNSSQDTSSIEDVSITSQEKGPALMNVFADMGMQFWPWIEAAVISNCKIYGRRREQYELQETYNQMKSCVKNEPLFISSKDQVIANIEECSRESINRTESCLPDEQRYFPGFILDLVKSMVNFLYDDFDIIRVELGACFSRINRSELQMGYIQCLTDIVIRTRDTIEIPRSKALVCKTFIQARDCFNGITRLKCDKSFNSSKLRQDLMEAMKRPCGKEKSN